MVPVVGQTEIKKRVQISKEHPYVEGITLQGASFLIIFFKIYKNSTLIWINSFVRRRICKV